MKTDQSILKLITLQANKPKLYGTLDINLGFSTLLSRSTNGNNTCVAFVSQKPIYHFTDLLLQNMSW